VKGEEAMARQIGGLLHALEDGYQPGRDLAGRWPAVFLDYDAPRSTGVFVGVPTTRGWPG
jgi:hypothetical protein